MAYVDFSSDPMLAYAGGPQHDIVTAQETGLSALEWSVVALAQRDRIASLATPGRLSIALGAVFGTRRHSPHLADPRLEALRRMAVLSWHRGFAVPVNELKAFLRAGFSTAQYETLLASISASRSRLGAKA
jgi:alkylhydroperoxidase family enzyme